MKRPNGHSKEVAQLIAEGLWPRVRAWLISQGEPAGQTDSDREEVITNLARAVRSDSDGFEIACTLKSDGWSPDSSLVDILDDTLDLRYQAHRKLVAEWVKSSEIAVPFTVGDRVIIPKGDGKRVSGEVIAVDAEQASCTVNCPELGHVRGGPGRHGRVVPFEDIVREQG